MSRAQRIVHVVNRSTVDLDVTDDGVPWVVPAGYRLEPIEIGDEDEKAAKKKAAKEPEIQFWAVPTGVDGKPLMVPMPKWAAIRAVRQHPVMGTMNPLNPNEFASYISIVEFGMALGFVPRSDGIERLDRSKLPESEQKVVVVTARGGRRPIKVGPRKKGETMPNELSDVRGDFIVPELSNPCGIRVEY